VPNLELTQCFTISKCNIKQYAIHFKTQTTEFQHIILTIAVIMYFELYTELKTLPTRLQIRIFAS